MLKKIKLNKYLISTGTFFLLIISQINANDFNKEFSIQILSGETSTKFLNKKYQGLLRNNSTVINPIANFYNDGFEFNSNIFFSDNKITVKELFIKKNYNDISFIIGRFTDHLSSEDKLMSSGSMVESGNALGIPRLGFQYSKKINNHKINFHYYHGEFNMTEWFTQKPKLHEKKLYYTLLLRENEFTVGLTHAVIWGGSSTKFGAQPQGFEDYFRVVFGNPGRENATLSDQINTLGETVGMWDFSYKRKINENLLSLYFQNFFEDGSGLKLKNKMSQFDGLWGINFNNNKFSILFEHLKTTYQGGPVHPPGLDSFYWSGDYPPGWEYNGQTIGNMIISTNNNRVKANFLSIAKYFNKQSLKINYLRSEEYFPYIGTSLDYNILFPNFENNIYREYNFIYSISFLKYEVGLNLGKNNLSKLNGVIEINYNL